MQAILSEEEYKEYVALKKVASQIKELKTEFDIALTKSYQIIISQTHSHPDQVKDWFKPLIDCMHKNL